MDLNRQKTIVSNENDIHKGHKDWLKKQYEKHYHH
jgi:hypothetical protein